MNLVDRVLLKAVTFFGPSRCITEIMPKDVRGFVENELDLGFKSHSVRSFARVLSLVAGFYIRENDLPIQNPFNGVRIPDFGKDVRRFERIAPEKLSRLRYVCREIDDDIRWLLAILMDTGARTWEICGAGVDDFRLDEEIPVLHIRKRPWRRLKTRDSHRVIPLFGLALWAARRVIETAAPGQKYAFPRYIADGRRRECRSGLRCFLRAQQIDQPVHRLRHTFIDRLREIDCPIDVQHYIMGWKANTLEAEYGVLPSIDVVAHWMQSVCGDGGIDLRPLEEETSSRSVLENLTKLVDFMERGSRHSFEDLRAAKLLTPYELVNAIRRGRRLGLLNLTPPDERARRTRQYFLTCDSVSNALNDLNLKREALRKLKKHECNTRQRFLSLRATCFPDMLSPSVNVVPAQQGRIRPALARKWEEAFVWAMPTDPVDKLISTRVAAERILGLLQPRKTYRRKDICAKAGLSAEEFTRGRNSLYQFGVIEMVHEIKDGVSRLVMRLTGKPLPPRVSRTVLPRSRMRLVPQHALSGVCTSIDDRVPGKTVHLPA
ncbi:site-specific integrase [Cupriavidus lacunae]|nr:tyrosine-type recombinase/integrase [Cupriavidus lacunae]